MSFKPYFLGNVIFIRVLNSNYIAYFPSMIWLYNFKGKFFLYYSDETFSKPRVLGFEMWNPNSYLNLKWIDMIKMAINYLRIWGFFISLVLFLQTNYILCLRFYPLNAYSSLNLTYGTRGCLVLNFNYRMWGWSKTGDYMLSWFNLPILNPSRKIFTSRL